MAIILRPWFENGKLRHVDTICPEEVPFLTMFGSYFWFWPKKTSWFAYLRACEIIKFPPNRV